MDLRDAILSRRSIRKFEDREVPTELLIESIRLACWAPNASNLQYWRFFVVKNRDAIQNVAGALQAKAAQLSSSPDSQQYADIIRSLSGNSAVLSSAPALIAIGAEVKPSPAEELLKGKANTDPVAAEIVHNRAGSCSHVQTVASAASHLVLSLHSQGLGSVWMAGPMIVRPEIERILEVPSTVQLFTILSVGYPAETPDVRPRVAVEDVVRIIA